jgi:ABC-type branched-subunit amino acid transport system substrate-binding protein
MTHPHRSALKRGGRRRLVPALLLPVALLVTGCGSTALRGGNTETAASGADQGLNNSGQNGSATTGDGGSSTGVGGGTGTAGVLPGSGSGGTSGSLTTGGAATGSAGSSTGGATGSTGTTLAPTRPIRLGLVVPDNTAIAASFGKKAHDAATSPKRIIAYINAHGGISGHKISTVIYLANTASDADTESQKACATFTQDNKVDVVISFGVGGTVLPACLLRRGIPLLDANWFAVDSPQERQFPNWIVPNAMALDRSISAIMRNSAAGGVLKRGAKVGVLVENCPWGPRVYSGTVAPLAKQLGVSVTQATLRCITNLVSDLGPVTNDIQRATLQFASAGVTNVMFITQAEAFVATQFTKNASQQKYYPKYSISSIAYPYQDSDPQGVVTYSDDAKPNIFGVGTIPLLDVGPLATMTAAQSNGAKTCTQADPDQDIAAAEKGKVTYYFDLANFYARCDLFFDLKDTLEANGVKLGLSDFLAGYQKMQSTHAPVLLQNGRFAQGQLYSAGYTRPFGYDTARKQWHYLGGVADNG